MRQNLVAFRDEGAHNSQSLGQNGPGQHGFASLSAERGRSGLRYCSGLSWQCLCDRVFGIERFPNNPGSISTAPEGNQEVFYYFGYFCRQDCLANLREHFPAKGGLPTSTATPNLARSDPRKGAMLSSDAGKSAANHTSDRNESSSQQSQGARFRRNMRVATSNVSDAQR